MSQTNKKLSYNAFDNEEVTGRLPEQVFIDCNTLRNEEDEEVECSRLFEKPDFGEKRRYRSLPQRAAVGAWRGA